jgi:hypothetical protein
MNTSRLSISLSVIFGSGEDWLKGKGEAGRAMEALRCEEYSCEEMIALDNFLSSLCR